MTRVVVLGATGAGKSILAQRLAARLGAEYVELDALFWDAGWTPAAPDVFRARVERATAGPRWVVAGNYGRVRDLPWPRADTIVWLDHAFPLVLRRLAARTVRRTVTGEVLWNGNREYFWEHCRVGSGRSGRCSTGSSRPTGPIGASCPSSSPSRVTPTSGSRACGGPVRQRRGSPTSRPE
jgi:hypothetical protein